MIFGALHIHMPADAIDGGDGQDGGLLAKFAEYIITRKTVPLEALALEFGMRTQVD